jgi:hypothetical protein
MGILDRCESRQGKTVRQLAVHSTEGNDTPRVNDAASLRDAAWWTGSSHAICDNEALLTPAEGCVPYDRAAWTLRSGNLISENIEQVGWARWTRAEWLAHPGTLENTARWLADRSKARGIPLVKLSPADVAAGKWGVIGHVDWTVGMKDGTHTDPGPNYPWDVVIPRARQIASGSAAPNISGESDMAVISSPGRGTAVVGPGYFRPLNAEEAGNTAPFGPVIQGNDRQFDLWRSMALSGTTAVWSTTVSRTDASTDGKTVAVPALQELADAKTQAIAAAGQIAGLQSALGAVSAGKAVDVDGIAAAVQDAVQRALADSTVKVNVDVAGGTAKSEPQS